MRKVLVAPASIVFASVVITAQSKPVPRPPAQGRGQPADESTAFDGYQPLPQWLGQTRAPAPQKTAAFDVQSFAEGLNGAFSLHFLPDGRIVVGERAGGGRIKIVGKDGKVSEPLGGLPEIGGNGPQGLFDVQPDRNFASNRTVYLTYTALPQGSDRSKLPRLAGTLRVASAKLSADDRKLESVRELLDAEGIGGRVIQANDGTLLVTSSIPAGVGIHSEDWPQPQQLDSLMGKVLRINTDGSIPKDNPFVGKAGARPEIFALGIRDDQGVAIQPKTGTLWTSEHGPRGGDEINAIEKGKNYGFPIIGYGHDYTGKPINHDKTAQAGMEQPVYFWTPDIAPAGIAFYSGRMFPAWDGDLFVSALAGRDLVRLVLNGRRVIAEERLLGDLNARIRGVAQGPDDALYVLTDGMGGKILRLVRK